MSEGTTRRRLLMRWLRLLALVAVVLLLARMVHWHDRIDVPDGSVLEGRITRWAEDGARIETLDGPAVDVSVAPDASGRRPRVAYGLASTMRRLGEHPGQIATVALVLALLVAMTAWRWHALVVALGLRLGRWRALGLTWIGGFFNLAVPGSTGGDVVKAWYAAKDTGAGPRAVLTVFVDRVIGLVGLVLLAALVLAVQPAGDGQSAARRVVLIAGVAMLVMGIVFMVRPLRRRLGLARLVGRLPFQHVISELRAGLALYRRRPLALAGALGISLVNHAGAALAVAALADALDIQGATPAACLAAVPLANLLSAIPLAPGGWGVGEWAFATFLAPHGVAATEAVTLSIVYRFMTLAANAPGGLLWASWRTPIDPDDIRADVEAAALEAAHDVEAHATPEDPSDAERR
ncbi:MAG: lysylphosphatidylglycerol synthase transmembrane domain-containing protein [Planctomycetota bacterium]